MTITLGFWMVPAAITLIGLLWLGTWRPRGDYDFSGAIFGFLFMGVAGTAWLMWLVSWLF